MKRNQFLKNAACLIGGTVLFSCDREIYNLSPTNSNTSFNAKEAQLFYESIRKNANNARQSSDSYVPRWEVSWSYPVGNGDERVVVPVKYTDSVLPVLGIETSAESFGELVSDVVNYGKLHLLFTKNQNGDIISDLLVTLPTKEYSIEKSNIVEGWNLTGIIAYFDLELKNFRKIERYENGFIKSSLQDKPTSPNGRLLLKEVCVDYYSVACANGICYDPVFIRRECREVVEDDGQNTTPGGGGGGPTTGGGGTGPQGQPTLVTNPNPYANTDQYVNFYSYMDQNPNDWDAYDKPCDNLSYGGETGLSSSEVFARILLDESMDQLGITDIAAGISILTGWNFISTREKMQGATKGTSFLSKYVSPLIPGNSTKPFPTLTGFPGIGSGLRISTTKSFGRIVTRGIPVIGWGLFAYDAYRILENTISKYYQVQEQNGCL